jgi:putative hemolysin
MTCKSCIACLDSTVAVMELAGLFSYELSYVAPGSPVWRQLLMRAIENVSGRRRLLPVYRHWSTAYAGKMPDMWCKALELIDTRLEVRAASDWHMALPDGPLVVIANHPFGIADGIAILALAERIGRPYRIIINADFMRLPEIQPLGLPIDFNETKAALETNLRTRAEARRLLKEGVTIVIFPAGGVATAETLWGDAEELPWKQFTARLVQQASATVLPVYLEGQNSRLFHFVSRYSLSIRLALLVSEFRHQVGGVIRARVGPPISYQELATGNTGEALIDHLYAQVQRLAPGAELADPAPLRQRPADQRRRFPWDPPQAAQPAAVRTARG